MKTKQRPIDSSRHLSVLRARLGRIRRKYTLVTLTTGLSQALLIVLSVLLIEGALDWLVELPWLGRALILAATLGSTGWLLWKYTYIPLRKRLDEDAMARMIERAMPIFETRYISSIQLGRQKSTSSSVLVAALLGETAAMASRLSFQAVVRTKRMRKQLLGAVAIILLAGAALYFGGHASLQLLRRALLSTEQLPRKTQITVTTGDRQIGIGEDLSIEVKASGVLPQEGRIVSTSASGRTQEFVLTQDPQNPSTYTALIRSPQEDFTYRAYLNDAESPRFDVKTLLRPAVAEVKARQVFPDYVGLPPEPRVMSDLNLLIGSRLELEIHATAPIAKGQLKLVGKDEIIPLNVDETDPSVLRGTIPVDDPAVQGFSVDLVDTAGIQSGQTAVYRVSARPDANPKVSITVPNRREILATSGAVIPVGFTAEDDIGVDDVTLHFKARDSEPEKIEFELGGKRERVVKRRFEWKLSAIEPKLLPGDVVEFWMTARDANSSNGRGEGQSEPYRIRIVTEAEKRADLANRFNDTMSGLSEVTGDQEALNRDLGELIFQKAEE